MRGYLMAGNWKMNTLLPEAVSLAKEVAEASKTTADDCSVAVCAPFPYLTAVKDALAGSKVGLGAQDCYTADAGAFTGAVSTGMLESVGCDYVLSGHSERRATFGDSDEDVNEKTLKILAQGLKCILCIGELKEVRRPAPARPRAVAAAAAAGRASARGRGRGRGHPAVRLCIFSAAVPCCRSVRAARPSTCATPSSRRVRRRALPSGTALALPQRRCPRLQPSTSVRHSCTRRAFCGDYRRIRRGGEAVWLLASPVGGVPHSPRLITVCAGLVDPRCYYRPPPCPPQASRAWTPR